MIGFYFSGAGSTIQLPVNPAELTVRYKGNNHRAEVVKLGEINILRDRQLASVTMPVLLPGDDYYPFIVGRWRPPDDYIDFFRRTMENRQSLRMVVTEINLNMQVSVEDFDAQRVAGDHESVQCSLSLLEYRSYGVRVLKVPVAATQTVYKSGPKRKSGRPKNKTHTVKPGESFWAIAQRELGDGRRYNEIAKLNGMTAASVIHPGDVLKLPEK